MKGREGWARWRWEPLIAFEDNEPQSPTRDPPLWQLWRRFSLHVHRFEGRTRLRLQLNPSLLKLHFETTRYGLIFVCGVHTDIKTRDTSFNVLVRETNSESGALSSCCDYVIQSSLKPWRCRVPGRTPARLNPQQGSVVLTILSPFYCKSLK